MNTVTIQIKTKRISSESEKALTILTSSYGGRFIHIPKSQIKGRKQIPNGSSSDLDFTELALTKWIYHLKIDELKRLSEYDLKIL